MQLTRIKIENLRAIDSLAIDLSEASGGPRRQLVLLGVNGSGKTTVLDAIAHGFDVVGSDEPDEFGARGLLAGDVRGSRGAPATDDALGPRGTLTVTAVLSSAEHHAVRRRIPDAPAQGSFEFTWGDMFQIIAQASSPWGDFRDVARAALIEARPPCVLLPADRGVLEAGDEVTFKEASKFDPRAGCLSKERARFAPLAARLMMAFLVPKQADPGGAVARMWKVLARYFPELPRPTEVQDGELWFQNAAGHAVPLEALSEGERAILLMFGEIALRAPKDGVVMIDEVEQHLHPRWQRAVLDALPALVPSAQFILTTQAPYVAMCAPDDTLKLGDWEGRGE